MTKKKIELEDMFKLIQEFSGGIANKIRSYEIPKFAKDPHHYLNMLLAQCGAEMCGEWSEETKEKFLSTLPPIVKLIENFDLEDGMGTTGELAMLSVTAPRSVGFLISRFCMLMDVCDDVVEGVLNMETGDMMDASKYLKWRFAHGLKALYELAKIYNGEEDKITLFMDLAHIKVDEDGYHRCED